MTYAAPIKPSDRLTERNEAEAIAAICTAELSSRLWSEDARGDLREIRSAACGVIDHEDGHEGFQDARAEMERRLGEWADNTDFRTFPRLSDADLVAHSKNHGQFNRQNREAR